MAIHSLSASRLGLQYIIKTDRALRNLVPIERYYLSVPERKDCRSALIERGYEIDTKLKLAKREFKTDIVNNPNTLKYFIDYLEPSSQLADVSVDSLYPRVYSYQQDNIKYLYNYLFHLLYAFVTVICCVLTYFVCSKISFCGKIGFFLKILVCIGLPNLLFFIIYLKFPLYKICKNWIISMHSN